MPKKKNKGLKLGLFVVALIVISLLGTFLFSVFTPQTISALQVVGNQQEILQDANVLNDEMDSSEVAIIDKYRIVTTQTAQFTQSNDMGAVGNVFTCANKYQVFYKGELKENIVGTAEQEDFLTSGVFKNFKMGASVEDSNEADLTAHFRADSLYKTSPNRCVYTTNDFDLRIPQDSFTIDIDKNLEDGKVDILIDINNDYSDEVTANAEITYNLGTFLGLISKTERDTFSVSSGESSFSIEAPEEVLSNDVNVTVKLNILRGGDNFAGFNIPQHKCFRGDSEVAKSGKLMDVDTCEFIKIGEVEQSLSFNVPEEIAEDLEGEEVEEIIEEIEELNVPLETTVDIINELDVTEEEADIIYESQVENVEVKSEMSTLNIILIGVLGVLILLGLFIGIKRLRGKK
jgi:hypothetical protein